MHLEPHHVAALRQRYGAAYVTHALCDLHSNKAKSPVLELLGLSVGELDNWALSRRALHNYALEHATKIGNSLTDDPQALTNVAREVALNGLPFDMDSFGDIVGNLINWIKSGVSAGLSAVVGIARSWLAAFLAGTQRFCEFLLRVYETNAERIANISLLRDQVSLSWTTIAELGVAGFYKLVQIVRDLYTSFKGALHEAVISFAGFIGEMVQLFADSGGVDTVKGVAKQACYVLFYVYNVFNELLTLESHDKAEIELHLIKATALLPESLRKLFAFARDAGDLLTAPLTWLANTAFVRGIVGVASTVLGAVMNALSYVVTFVKNMLFRAVSYIAGLLPALFTRCVSYIGETFNTLMVRLLGDGSNGDAEDQLNKMQDMMQTGRVCEDMANRTDLSEKTREALRNCARNTRTVIDLQDEHQEQASLFERAAVKAEVIADWAVGNDPLENQDLIDRYCLTLTGLDRDTYVSLHYNLNAQQTGAILEALDERKARLMMKASKPSKTQGGVRKRRPAKFDVDQVQGAAEEARKRLEERRRQFNLGVQVLDEELRINSVDWKLNESAALDRIRNQIIGELRERLQLKETQEEVTRLEENELPGFEKPNEIAKWTTVAIVGCALGLAFYLTYCARKSELTAVKEQNMARYFRTLKEKAADSNPMLEANIRAFEKAQSSDFSWSEIWRGELDDHNIIERWKYHSALFMDHVDKGEWTKEETTIYGDIAQSQLSKVLGDHVEEINAKIAKTGLTGALESLKDKLLGNDPSVVAALAVAAAARPPEEQLAMQKYLEGTKLTAFGQTFDLVTKWVGPKFDYSRFILGQYYYNNDREWNLTVRHVWRVFGPTIRAAQVSAEVEERALRIAEVEGPWALAKNVALASMERIKSVGTKISAFATNAGLLGVAWEDFSEPKHWFDVMAGGGLPQAYQLTIVATGSAIAFWGVTQLFVHIVYGIVFFMFAKNPQQLKWYREWGMVAAKIVGVMGSGFLKATAGVLQIRCAAWMGLGLLILAALYILQAAVTFIAKNTVAAAVNAIKGLWSITGGMLVALFQVLINGKTVPVNPILHLRLSVFSQVFPNDPALQGVSNFPHKNRKASNFHGTQVVQKVAEIRTVYPEQSSPNVVRRRNASPPPTEESREMTLEELLEIMG